MRFPFVYCREPLFADEVSAEEVLLDVEELSETAEDMSLCVLLLCGEDVFEDDDLSDDETADDDGREESGALLDALLSVLSSDVILLSSKPFDEDSSEETCGILLRFL